MKKLSLILAVVMIMSVVLCSCGKNANNAQLTTTEYNNHSTISDEEKAYISEKESIAAVLDSAPVINKDLKNAIKLPQTSSDVKYEIETGFDWDSQKPCWYYEVSFLYNDFFIDYAISEVKNLQLGGSGNENCTKQFERKGVTYAFTEMHDSYFWQARWSDDGKYSVLATNSKTKGTEIPEEDFVKLLRNFFADIDKQ